MSNISREELARRIRHLMKLRDNMTPSELSRRSGLSRSYIGDILKERAAAPSLEAREKLARALQVPIEYLIVEQVDDEPDVQITLGDITVLLRGPGAKELSEKDRRSIQDFIEFVRRERGRQDKEV